METFVGSGNIPYAAIRESYVKARELLSNLNGEFSNGVHGQDQGETEDGAEEAERKDQEEELMVRRWTRLVKIKDKRYTVWKWHDSRKEYHCHRTVIKS